MNKTTIAPVLDPAAYYRFAPADVAARLKSDPSRGLDTQEAVSRSEHIGKNLLIERGVRPLWLLLWDQFASTLVFILLIAAAISAFVGSLKDAIAILAIILLNAALGFVQEFRAERAMAALRRLAVPKVRVRRDGMVVELSSSDLVPGDLVFLEAGNLVPADGRIFESASLRIQEAVLTGESVAVEKQTAPLTGDDLLSIGDQSNMIFMGTSVAHGRGLMMVTATGMNTELGRVADLLQGVGSMTTPLQQRLNRLGHSLAFAALFVVLAIFGLGILMDEDWKLMFMTSVSMAVAVIPEGLPAVVTIALALGAQRMLRRNALIRRLPAVETLGSVTVICSDKTGTLTENRMTVTVLDLAGHRIDISEELIHRMPVTAIKHEGTTLIKEKPSLALLLMGGALCSDAVLKPDSARPGNFHAVGDPTEGAFVIAAARYGLLKDRLDAAYPRIAEMPFDSDRKRMTTVHRITECNDWIGGCIDLDPDASLVFTKGAVDSLLSVCSHVLESGNPTLLGPDFREQIIKSNDELAREGMRVLGVAFRQSSSKEPLRIPASETYERELVFVGLVGMLDPPRAEAHQAVAICRSAGIRPVMITGDHPVTARRIARDLGILGEGQVINGSELQGLSQLELDQRVENVSVFARVAPEQKLRIVEALQRQGQVVAMTGDGVNDAPALRRADIGIAMGITGTDVSKEAAAMVLLNDNFTTIVTAVKEGRAINDNIRRFLMFSLAGNIGKVLPVFLFPLLGMPLPLLPFQILWLNLVTDGALGLGIGVEEADPDTMHRPPQSPSSGIFSGGLGITVLWLGFLLGAINFVVAYWAFNTAQPGWQTIVMTTVVFLQMVEAHVSRSSKISLFRLNPLSNKALFITTLLVGMLQAIVIYVPMLHGIFGTQALSLRQLLVPAGAGLILLVIVEIKKWIGRIRDRINSKEQLS